MTILFVDHHDSFVNNLSSWFKKNYSGGTLVVNYSDLNQVQLKNISGVVFSPGPGHPEEYENSIQFYKKLSPTLPFLGVCLGYQIMLYSHGAKLHQVATKPIHGYQVHLRRKIKSRFLSQDAIQGYFVMYNSLGISAEDFIFQKEFSLLVAKDNFSLAAEHISRPHMGVQFHPESFASSGGVHFMRCFLKLIEHHKMTLV